MHFIADAFGNCRCNCKIADAIQNADTPIFTDGLMSLVPLSKSAASNVADWREARMWLREMESMGLHRIESIMDRMTLILPTKLKSKISARAKSLIETAACTHSRIASLERCLGVAGPYEVRIATDWHRAKGVIRKWKSASTLTFLRLVTSTSLCRLISLCQGLGSSCRVAVR